MKAEIYFFTFEQRRDKQYLTFLTNDNCFLRFSYEFYHMIFTELFPEQLFESNAASFISPEYVPVFFQEINVIFFPFFSFS